MTPPKYRQKHFELDDIAKLAAFQPLKDMLEVGSELARETSGDKRGYIDTASEKGIISVEKTLVRYATHIEAMFDAGRRQRVADI